MAASVKSTSTARVSTTSAFPSSTGAFSLGFWVKILSYSTQFAQVFSWHDVPGNVLGADTGEQGSNPGTTLDVFAPGSTFDPKSVITGSDTSNWYYIAVTYPGSGTAFTIYVRKEKTAAFTTLTSDGGSVFTFGTFNLFSDATSNANTLLRSFWIQSGAMTAIQIMNTSLSLSPPAGTNVSALALNDHTVAGNNLGTGANWTITGTLATQADEPDPSLPLGWLYERDENPSPSRVREVIRRSSLAAQLSGSGMPLPTLSAPAAGIQFYGDAAQFPRSRTVVDRGALGSSAPIVVASTTSTLTWLSHSPLRLVKSSGTDGGADAISPLIPSYGSWFPDFPDVQRPRRWGRDESGSGLQIPLSAAAVIFVQPDAASIPCRRPRADDSSDLGQHPLYLANLSWFAQEGEKAKRTVRFEAASDLGQRPLYLANLSWFIQEGKPAPRRIQFEDWSALGEPTVDLVDLSWALQTPIWAPRRPSGGYESPVFLPVFQPQVPSWLPEPADVVRRVVRSDDQGSAAALLALAQMSSWWLPDAPQIPPRRPLSEARFFTPQPTTVTLSSWGWIPEVPSRPGIRKIDPTPVSVLIPPAIVTVVPNGWWPQVPDRPRRPVVLFEAHSALGAQVVQGPLFPWPDDSPWTVRRRVQRGEDVIPISPGMSVWGWFQEAQHQRRLAARSDAQAQGPFLPISSTAPFWMHWQVGPRPRGPIVSGAYVLPLPTLVSGALSVMPPMDGGFVVVTSKAALRAAILAGYPVAISGGAVTIGDLRAILQEIGAYRAVLQEVGDWRAILKS